MKLEEAKLRGDYKFLSSEIETYIEQIRNKKLNGFYHNGDGARGIAVMEVGCVDIEVNLYSAAQVILGADENCMIPVIDYFCCLKVNDNQWESDSCLDYSVNVDWYADNWKELLEKDMFKALDMYVKANNLSYDKPNKLPYDASLNG